MITDNDHGICHHLDKSSHMEVVISQSKYHMILKQALDEKKALWAEKASDNVKRAYTEGIEEVVKSGIVNTAKTVGAKAPTFTLANATGKKVKLTDYLIEGPVILTWYRGGWCPYCNITLKHLQEALPSFQARGAHLLALTPEVPDKSLTTVEKNNLRFEVLSDIDNKVAKSYGIIFKLIPEVADMYQAGFDLAGYNGNDKAELPLAATYVIDKEGTIRYSFLDAEYRNRAEPEDILQVLDNLTGHS